jgi:hypothetical protein
MGKDTGTDGQAGATMVANGPEDVPAGWDAVDWRQAEDDVRRLRQRIFTASQAGDRGGAARCSQIAFHRGAWMAVRRILAPVVWKTASKERVTFGPRSRMRNLISSNRLPRSCRDCGLAAPSAHRRGSR